MKKNISSMFSECLLRIAVLFLSQGWAQGKKKKPEVKILGDYCMKKMQHFPT